MEFSDSELGWLKAGVIALAAEYRENLSFTWRDDDRAEYERLLAELDALRDKLGY